MASYHMIKYNHDNTNGRIDFDRQEVDVKKEADLDREDAEQQKELKDFLDQEFDDADLFDGTFNLNQSHVYEENLLQNHQVSGNQANDVPRHFASVVRHSYSHTDKFSRNIIGNPFSVSQQRLPQNVASSQYNDYNDNITIPYKSDVPPPGSYSGLITDHLASNRNDAQLQILYQARGRKIEELQKKLELLDEETSKDKRILQHKLILTTGERDGLKESNTQLQNLLQEHKRSIATLNDHIQHKQDENQHLNNQLDELSDKLQLTEAIINSLESQFKQMSETESLSRAGTQHESMLANLCKKHEEEILSLKERLDESSEIGMLRHRLAEEENKNVQLTDSLVQLQKKNAELKEQLQVFYSAQKMPSLFSSTPFHVENQLVKEKLEVRIPISQNTVTLFDKGKLIFHAPGSDLKITSMKKPLVGVSEGVCELYLKKPGSYLWFISNPSGKLHAQSFKCDHTTKIELKIRDRQFTIVVKLSVNGSNNSVMFIGTLKNKSDIDSLKMVIEDARKGSESPVWISAKENIKTPNSIGKINTSAKNANLDLVNNKTSQRTPLNTISGSPSRSLSKFYGKSLFPSPKQLSLQKSPSSEDSGFGKLDNKPLFETFGGSSESPGWISPRKTSKHPHEMFRC